ncbi:hypothetical protein I601_2008 [Nocardioides dokdonensis FR1436]|uniref:MmcQ/YjbR family DNA-binding protein n=1 Tax=Nocardioides dokdonensis FR1436 TaxID=1300347 RepID=A0A1A9GK30_9ACTN|nr:MmcQ/YjbR family DNA-binding protein [Nocardioides dokdonensis]ANH38436.1 hypothetical protein I601_2008 [Nocardioides dokdonensis FR1436]
MDLGELHELATSFDGVTRTTREGRARWELGGRLIAREVDATQVVVRVPFDLRDQLVLQHPDVFSVPRRFASHMLVVAALDSDDPDTRGALEEAVAGAWELQRHE